ncbi:MAG: OB-fold nucleic acid binding domain-containing protein [Methanobacteriaceae archaeon]
MKKDCPECKGKGYKVEGQKTCPACDGLGFQDTLELKGHFKGVASGAKAKFDLESDEDVPCEKCNGKGTLEISEKCDLCEGTGEIDGCKGCGKLLNSENSSKDSEYLDYCKECQEKLQEKAKKEEEEKEKARIEKLSKKDIVYVLDPFCEMEDLEIGENYKGTISKVQKFGVFVSLSKKVWGLMRTEKKSSSNNSNYQPSYNVGEEIIVKVSQIKKERNEVDMTPSPIIGNYEVKTLKKNIARTKIQDLDSNMMKKVVSVIGEVIQIQQTAGPTIFTISDETAITWAAAFDEAGVRSYPEIESGDIIEVLGEVTQHSGKMQIESESITKVDGEEEKEIRILIEKALDERADVEDVPFLLEKPLESKPVIESEVLNKLKPKMMEAARRIRRAMLEGRSILVRHHADADGICAGIAMEKAVVPLLREISPEKDAEWYYFKRSPSKAPFYEMEDVVKDLSFALEDQVRHGQKLPLIVLMDNGSTEEDLLALIKAKIYDIEIVVIDHHFPGEVIDGKVEVDEFVDVHVNPYLVGGDSQITAGALGAEVANIINNDVGELISHLPGIAAVGDHANSKESDRYIEIAREKGYTKEDLDKVAACVDFEAYYLRFMNGRGIMDTILNVDKHDKHEKLVTELFKAYNKKVDIQLKATLPNIKQSKLDNGILFNVLDIEKYAHRFTFPAPGKTCGFVHDAILKENIKGTGKSEDDIPILTLSYGPDFGVIRATSAVNKIFGFNLNEIIIKLRDAIKEAGIDGGGHECAGSIKFLEGLSDEVLSEFAQEIANMEKK